MINITMKNSFGVIVFLFALPLVFADLQVGFYSSSCPRAETIVQQVVQRNFKKDRTITAALLRMHFHDCFVRGCDASILIDSTEKKKSEKSAGPNRTVRGYELIDEVKKTLEAQCPSTVSCANIITLATRDAVAMAGGPKYTVPTGRRDGLVSNPSEVNLPGPSSSVSGALQTFTEKGLDLNDMVTLLGAHSVGVAHCSFFQDRLTPPDPSMDPTLAAKLKSDCASTSNNDPAIFLDQNTSFVMDNQFYNQIQLKKGILQIDQELTSDSSSSIVVSGFASDGVRFSRSFADAMVKMGNIEVLEGNAGEIRKKCSVFNSHISPRP